MYARNVKDEVGRSGRRLLSREEKINVVFALFFILSFLLFLFDVCIMFIFYPCVSVMFGLFGFIGSCLFVVSLAFKNIDRVKKDVLEHKKKLVIVLRDGRLFVCLVGIFFLLFLFFILLLI